MQGVKAAFSLACAVCACGCGQKTDDSRPAGGCLEQANATYDSVVLVLRNDSTLWSSAADAPYQRVESANGALLGTSIAASGSSAYGDAIGCAVLRDGSTWCFPIAGPLLDSTNLGVVLG